MIISQCSLSLFLVKITTSEENSFLQLEVGDKTYICTTIHCHCHASCCHECQCVFGSCTL